MGPHPQASIPTVRDRLRSVSSSGTGEIELSEILVTVTSCNWDLVVILIVISEN